MVAATSPVPAVTAEVEVPSFEQAAAAFGEQATLIRRQLGPDGRELVEVLWLTMVALVRAACRDALTGHARTGNAQPVTQPTEDGALMAAAMLCTECGNRSPATVLIVHPDLYQMLVPACAAHGAPRPGLDVIAYPSPEATEVLATHTILRGVVVPRTGG